MRETSFSIKSGLRHQTLSIPTKDIVALLPPSPGSGSTYKLLFTITDTSTRLQTLDLSRPPDLLEGKYLLKQLPDHLHYGAENIHVIISATSGTGQAPKYFAETLKPLLQHVSVRYTAHTTESATSIGDLAEKILTQRVNEEKTQKLIILLSGDTGLHEYINGIPKNGHPQIISMVGLVGTGNALASSLNLNLHTLIFGHACKLPTFTARFSPGSRSISNEGKHFTPLSPDANAGTEVSIRGAVVCSWGLHASLVGNSDTKEYRKHGAERFAMVAGDLAQGKWSNGKMHEYHGRVKMFTDDDTKLMDESNDLHSYLLLSLFPKLAPGFDISPKRSNRLLDDDVDNPVYTVYVPSVSPAELMEVMGAAMTGGVHLKLPNVGYYQTRGWRLDMMEPDVDDLNAGEKGRWRRICVDGRIIEVEKDGWVQVEVDKQNDGDESLRILWKDNIEDDHE